MVYGNIMISVRNCCTESDNLRWFYLRGIHLSDIASFRILAITQKE